MSFAVLPPTENAESVVEGDDENAAKTRQHTSVVSVARPQGVGLAMNEEDDG